MLERGTAQEVLERMLSRGGDFAEVFLEEQTATTLRLDDGKIEELVTGVDQGAGFRLVDGEHTHFASSNRIDRESLLALAEDMASGMGEECRAKPLPFSERALANPSFICIPPDTVAIERKVELLRRADGAARGFDRRIVQATVLYRDLVREIRLANSEGVFDGDRQVHSLLYVIAVGKDGELVQTGMKAVAETKGFELFEEEPPEAIAEEAARRAVVQLTAKPAPAGTFTVILSAEAGGTMIHEACGHGLEGDFVKRGLSVYAGKLGQKVASHLITVIDDGMLPNKRGTARMDDEGEPTQRVVLIENGILKGYLQSRKSALETGLRRTGNGRRMSFRHLPIPRMRNTLVAPGKTPPEEIVASVKEGILVKQIGGGQVDIVSGSFVFQVMEAYLIRDGKVGEAIRGATLTGNGPRVLEEVDMVGSDLGFAVGTCGKDGQGVPVSDAQPTMRLPRIVVGGLVGGGA